MTVTNCATDPWAPSPVFYHSDAFLLSDDATVPTQALPDFSGSGPPNHTSCQTFESWRLVVPTGTPDGTYHFQGELTAPGRFRVITTDWYTGSFQVIGP